MSLSNRSLTYLNSFNTHNGSIAAIQCYSISFVSIKQIFSLIQKDLMMFLLYLINQKIYHQ